MHIHFVHLITKKTLMHSLNTASTMKICHWKFVLENIQYLFPHKIIPVWCLKTNTGPNAMKFKNTKASFVSINFVFWSETFLPHIATLKQFVKHSYRGTFAFIFTMLVKYYTLITSIWLKPSLCNQETATLYSLEYNTPDKI